VLLSVFGEQRKTAQTEVALAAHALDAMGDAVSAERDECRTREVTVPPSRSSYLAAIVGGGLGIVVLAVLVYSVLAVSRDAQQPVVEVKPPQVTAAPASPAAPPAPSAAPAPPVVAAAPTDVPPADAPSDVPTEQSAPTLQLLAPQAPLTAETMRPEPAPSPFAEFPRLHRWFPNLFPNG
jgi:hypothetical protein